MICIRIFDHFEMGGERNRHLVHDLHRSFLAAGSYTLLRKEVEGVNGRAAAGERFPASCCSYKELDAATAS